MKKTLAMVLAMGMTIASLTACGGSKPAETTAAATGAQTEAASSAADTKAEATEPAGGKAEGPITVVSREDGSGTRGAFIELFGIESKNDAGEKVDNTTEDAEITNSTSVMMTTIAGNKGAIGYVSLGSLNDTVKAVAIDGADATVDAIKAGEYKVARPAESRPASCARSLRFISCSSCCRSAFVPAPIISGSRTTQAVSIS